MAYMALPLFTIYKAISQDISVEHNMPWPSLLHKLYPCRTHAAILTFCYGSAQGTCEAKLEN
jgi:hypothetical protein